MAVSMPVKAGNIVLGLLVLAAGFLIEKNFLGHVPDWLGRARSPVGGGSEDVLNLI